jgi:putative endonuclease
MDKTQWVVYLIRCSDKSLYCGITNDLKSRLVAHNSGKGAKYTRSRRPVELVGTSSAMTKSDALKLEHRVKHVPAGSKYDVLIKEKDQMTVDLNQTLKNINKDLKELSRTVDKIIVAVGKLSS